MSGSAPLNDIDLQATVSGIRAGPFTYTFYCHRQDSSTDITPGYAARFVGESLNPKAVFSLCDYPTSGTYWPKVIVEREGEAAEDRINISVTSSSSTCWPLTRERNNASGGTLPIAAFPSSPGCSSGSYLAGDVIYLGVTPSAGWTVASWTGTSNNASTATTNSLVMPAAAHTVRVNYLAAAPTCYRLTLDHSGSGTDPEANPTQSPGCSADYYVSGESITLEANPAADWTVLGWDGTVDDASTSTLNQVVMGHANRRVEVTYGDLVVEVYPLSITIEGSGHGRVRSTDLVISCADWPGGGTHCAQDYAEGTRVTLQTEPQPGSVFTSWSGDDDCADGILEMSGPRDCHARFSSTSTACRSITMWRLGEGTIPVATPANSPTCPTGYYVADTLINFSGAVASPGWHIVSWSGTDNNASTASTNSYVMGVGSRSVFPNYGRVDGRATITTSQNVTFTGDTTRVGYDFNPNGLPLWQFVRYGPTTDYGFSTTHFPFSASDFESYHSSGEIVGLPCGSTFHAVAVAENSQGSAYGGDVAFQTPACPSDVLFDDDFETGVLSAWSAIVGSEVP